jgi:hypothetical protein
MKAAPLGLAVLALAVGSTGLADTHWVKGKVTKVDAAAQKLTTRQIHDH